MLEFTITAQFPSGDEAKFILREPTKDEWRSFLRERYPVKNDELQNNSSTARQTLFDKILVRVENACDDQGQITVKEKHRIPEKMKGEMIFHTFEEDDGKFVREMKLKSTSSPISSTLKKSAAFRNRGKKVRRQRPIGGLKNGKH